MPSEIIRGDSTLSKPEGGYCSISALTIGLLWWAYTRGGSASERSGSVLPSMSYGSVGPFSPGPSRKGNRPEFTPRFTTKELGDFCGLPRNGSKPPSRNSSPWAPRRVLPENDSPSPRSLDDLSLSADERPSSEPGSPSSPSESGSPYPDESSPWPASPRLRPSSPSSSGPASAAAGESRRGLLLHGAALVLLARGPIQPLASRHPFG